MKQNYAIPALIISIALHFAAIGIAAVIIKHFQREDPLQNSIFVEIIPESELLGARSSANPLKREESDEGELSS